jgi:hypothetical protein
MDAAAVESSEASPPDSFAGTQSAEVRKPAEVAQPTVSSSPSAAPQSSAAGASAGVSREPSALAASDGVSSGQPQDPVAPEAKPTETAVVAREPAPRPQPAPRPVRPQPEPRIPSATPLASAIAAATHSQTTLEELARAVFTAEDEARRAATQSGSDVPTPPALHQDDATEPMVVSSAAESIPTTAVDTVPSTVAMAPQPAVESSPVSNPASPGFEGHEAAVATPTPSRSMEESAGASNREIVAADGAVAESSLPGQSVPITLPTPEEAPDKSRPV